MSIQEVDVYSIHLSVHAVSSWLQITSDFNLLQYNDHLLHIPSTHNVHQFS